MFAINDDVLEGDECFSVTITAVMPNELTVIEGADSVNVIIEDDEGMDLLMFHTSLVNDCFCISMKSLFSSSGWISSEGGTGE